MNKKLKNLALTLTIASVIMFLMTPAIWGAEFDVTTQAPASQVAPSSVEPSKASAPGGDILWDTYHGVYLSYSPSARFSDLTSVLVASGYTVDENNSGILNLNLGNYDIIVICLGSAWYSAYSAAEVSAISNFVSNGGGLLILGDNAYCPNANINPVSQAFGTTLGLSDISDLPVTNLSSHPIFQGVSSLFMVAAGEISGSYPSSEQAWTDAGEAVVTVSESGSGRMVAMGDINLFENAYLGNANNQLFAENVFEWLTGPSCDYCLTGEAGYVWCLNILSTDSRAYYLDGTCDTGTTPLKDAHATYVYNTLGLTMTAYGGASGAVFSWNTKFISSTTARGVGVSSTGYGGPVEVYLFDCADSAGAEAPTGAEWDD